MKKEELLKFYDKFKLLIFPAVIVLSSLILIILVIYPQVTKLLANQKAAGEIAEKSKFLEAKVQTLESYDPADLALKVNSALSSYPVDKDYVNVLRLLQNIIAQSGFSIVSLSLGAVSERSGNVSSYGLKLDVLGPTIKLPTLLSNIESSYRLMRLSNLETSAGKDLQTSASLNVEVLYASGPVGFGSIDSPLPELSSEEETILARLARVGDITIEEQTTAQLGPRGKSDPFE